MTFAERVAEFNNNLDFNGKLPKDIMIMNPFKGSPQIPEITSRFYNKFYGNKNKRHLILGINPGRFGAGVTGIPFTDTKRLNEYCGIKIKGINSHELSSVFVYKMINAYGGVKKFYNDFFIGAVCPLGFIKNNGKGKYLNYNYYDSPELTNAVYGFIINNIHEQIKFGVYTDKCFCLGTGKNYNFLVKINSEYNFFEKIIPLEHPRFIMQYRAKRIDFFVDKYLNLLG